MNRAAARLRLFDAPAEYDLFVRTLAEAVWREPVSILAYCVMPTHFHLVVGFSQVHDVSRFMRRCTLTHAKRWRRRAGTTGQGAVYQGRFRAFSVGTDHHFLTVCRYVERNPVRAGLVSRAEAWPWGSFAQRGKNNHIVPLAEWPVLRPPHWKDLVNEPEPVQDLEDLRRVVRIS